MSSPLDSRDRLSVFDRRGPGEHCDRAVGGQEMDTDNLGDHVSRRRFLHVGGMLAGAAAVGAGSAAAGRTRSVAATLPSGLTGTIADLKHVVILMQENRSFD